MTEFNLSDKIPENPNYMRKYIKIDDVKEFIKLLKEESEHPYINKIIDRLAGDKLISPKIDHEEKDIVEILRSLRETCESEFAKIRIDELISYYIGTM